MLTQDLSIQEEVVEKLTNLLFKKNKFYEVMETKRIFNRIELENNRDIHAFVIAVNNLTKELEPETKVTLASIEAKNNVVPEVNYNQVQKALDKIKFASDDDRNIVYNYIRKSLN